jgi:hypothetical protein
VLCPLEGAPPCAQVVTSGLWRREEVAQVAACALAEAVGVVGGSGVGDAEGGADVGVAQVVDLLEWCVSLVLLGRMRWWWRTYKVL